MRKLSIEEIKDRVVKEAIGYECIDSKRKSSKDKLTLKCPNGHIFKIRLGNFTTGKRCSECAKKRSGSTQRLSIKYVRNKTKEIATGYKCLSFEYRNSRTKLKFTCNIGHEFYMHWDNFNSGNRCPVCYNENRISSRRLSINYIKSRTEEIARGYKCISDDYKNNSDKLKFICSKGHEFYSSWSNFSRKNGTRCKFCDSDNKKNRKSITIDFVKFYVNRFSYTCLSEEYINSSSKIHLLCPKGHEYYSTWNNFQRGYRCKKCFYDRNRKYNDDESELYKEYREVVDRYTNKNYIDFFYSINPNKIERSFYKYHLDHKFSIIDGFNNNIPSYIVANPFNLQMLWYKDNIRKNGNSVISLRELYSGYDKFLILKKGVDFE